jgi:hypothetical protein
VWRAAWEDVYNKVLSSHAPAGDPRGGQGRPLRGADRGLARGESVILKVTTLIETRLITSVIVCIFERV